MADQLPTVTLIEGEFYWVAPQYGDSADTWVAARWDVGCFWLGGKEIPPRMIVGPIPRPPMSPATPDAGGAG